MEKKKVSVIIPFYYGAQWLGDAIESALNQTYKNVEIIVINDCSPENIDDIIQKYDTRVLFIKHKKNQGSGPARNTGIEKATGEYISFLDSDDIWLPTKLEKQIQLMEKSGAMWCHTYYYHWRPDDNILKISKFMPNYGIVYPHILVSSTILQSSMIFDAKLLRDNPQFKFNPAVKYGQDGDLYSRIAVNYPLAFVNEPLVKKRETGYEIYQRPRLRIKLHAIAYQKMKNESLEGKNNPSLLMLLGRVYSVYNKILPDRETAGVNLFSKILWAFPFAVERIYRRYLDLTIKHDKKYLG